MFNESFVLCTLAHRTENNKFQVPAEPLCVVDSSDSPFPKYREFSRFVGLLAWGDWAIDVGLAHIRMVNTTAEIEGGLPAWVEH